METVAQAPLAVDGRATDQSARTAPSHAAASASAGVPASVPVVRATAVPVAGEPWCQWQWPGTQGCLPGCQWYCQWSPPSRFDWQHWRHPSPQILGCAPARPAGGGTMVIPAVVASNSSHGSAAAMFSSHSSSQGSSCYNVQSYYCRDSLVAAETSSSAAVIPLAVAEATLKLSALKQRLKRSLQEIDDSCEQLRRWESQRGVSSQ